MEVVDPLGEKVGKIETVVRSKTDSDIQAVVSSGGVLGIGDHKVAVPIDKLELSGDKVEISATEEELQQQEAYAPESFVELEPADRPLSEFSAFEPVPEEEVPIEEAPMSQPQEPIPEPDQPMTQPPEGSGGTY
ncbi:PRC-barrel domain-containing protein [Marinobacterium aestuariivivens]|uniref:PRC-barrel domain-containing protein n=1 Tax=Marinobacterium aestuariivivens TaxID=1698799 RepID=A0ABW2A8I1_9GAMM